MQWHRMTAEDVMERLGASPLGLKAEEAAGRLVRYGANELREKRRRTAMSLLAGQFSDFLIIVLIAAAVVSGIIGEPSDTIAIVVIVILNAVIGFFQEYRAERAMAALRGMAAPSALVLRDGAPVEIPAAGLVPGDLVMIDAGRIVPADMRLAESAHLRLDESALTGESFPVEKDPEALDDESLPLADRRNMLYKGTKVSAGRGLAVVTATGMETELGRIAAMLQQEEGGKTPLQRRLAAFGKRLAVAVLAICAIIFAVGIIRGEPAVRMLLTAISLAVAAIPEALPAVVTISLAIGAGKMVAHNALIRRLPAVETLGSVTCICSDKTGTLTQNRMTVTEVFVGGRAMTAEETASCDAGAEPLNTFLLGLALSNDARTGEGGGAKGDPTETALCAIAGERGFDKRDLEAGYRRIGEAPFDSHRKCMTTVHSLAPGGAISFTKGAVEGVLSRSVAELTAQGPVPLEAGRILAHADGLAARGLRVLALAVRRWAAPPADHGAAALERDLTFVGLVGLMDPPRPEAAGAVGLCRAAGIRPVMITGDHPLTALAIARGLGITDDRGRMLGGAELASLSDGDFERRAADVDVYARVTPEQKLRIVTALQNAGHLVAMTGDGVNDAPALQRADIGVAMGITGTDVAKEAADMVLLDDNFATIVGAVREGRKIYDNIRKFIKYLLTTNSGEIWTLFLAPLAGMPVPLLPIHILWINLLTDGLPALALSVEPPEGDLMMRPPRRPNEEIFGRGLGTHALWVGLLMAGIALTVQAWALRTAGSHWQTMVFTVLCLTQLGHALAIRSELQSLFSIGLFSNRPMLGAVLLSAGLQMAIIYTPGLNVIFKTAPLGPAELFITLLASTAVFAAVEIEKAVRRLRRGAAAAGQA